MKAVLLGAGFGTRLAPLTDRVPKILVPVAGEPLLARQLRYLAAQGIDEVGLNVHHLAAEVEDFLGSNDVPLRVHLFHEQEILGTAGALVPMRTFLTEPFAVLYGDVVTDMSLSDLRNGARGVATLAYYLSDDLHEKGVIELDGDERVVGFTEKPQTADGRSAVNAGVHILDPAVLRSLPERGDLATDVWPALIRAGAYVSARRLDGYLLDVGSHEALARLERDLAAGAVRW